MSGRQRLRFDRPPWAFPPLTWVVRGNAGDLFLLGVPFPSASGGACGDLAAGRCKKAISPAGRRGPASSAFRPNRQRRSRAPVERARVEIGAARTCARGPMPELRPITAAMRPDAKIHFASRRSSSRASTRIRSLASLSRRHRRVTCPTGSDAAALPLPTVARAGKRPGARRPDTPCLRRRMPATLAHRTGQWIRFPGGSDAQ